VIVNRLPAMFPEVSPDGRWLLYTTADDPVYEIMLVDNFW
jgi:Tol biopolymer transport system component